MTVSVKTSSSRRPAIARGEVVIESSHAAKAYYVRGNGTRTWIVSAMRTRLTSANLAGLTHALQGVLIASVAHDYPDHRPALAAER